MNRVNSYLLVAVGFLASGTAYAETNFRPRASLGFAAYSYEVIDVGTTVDVTSNYMKGGVGATVTFGTAYLDLAYSTSLDADYEVDLSSGRFTDDFERTDLTLTLGLPVGDNMTIFAGYKTGETEYTFTNPAPAPNGSLTYEASGIYGGVGFAVPSGNNVFSFNVALALLEAEETDSDGVNTFTDKSDASAGISLGAAYAMAVSDSMLLSFKGGLQSYAYTGWSDLRPDITETIISLDAELSFIF